jgi:hypothetical protein
MIAHCGTTSGDYKSRLINSWVEEKFDDGHYW